MSVDGAVSHAYHPGVLKVGRVREGDDANAVERNYMLFRVLRGVGESIQFVGVCEFRSGAFH